MSNREFQRPAPHRVPPDSDHWLVRPTTIRRLWVVFASVLAATVLLQFVVPIKGYFGIDGWFAFGAGFGFISCVLMVLAAKALGVLVKRPDDYYAEREDDV